MSRSGVPHPQAGERIARYPVASSKTEVDARWMMAFAASIGDTKPVHLDTTLPDGIVGHPLFPVSVEWPVLTKYRIDDLAETPSRPSTVVHASHDTTIHRLVKPGDSLSTELTVVGIESKPNGVLIHQLLETVDSEDQPVTTTNFGAFAVGRRLARPDQPPIGHDCPDWAWTTDPSNIREVAIPLGAGAAHVYTEGARIFNPIHTDRVAARAAGLDRPVLHGSAILAIAVSAIVDHVLDGAPQDVGRIAGRFTSMVTLPCALRVTWCHGPDGTIPFRVIGSGDTVVLDRGLVTQRPDTQ